MASLLAKTKASMEDKGLDGKEKEDPACAVSPLGDSSCEELRAQLAAGAAKNYAFGVVLQEVGPVV